MGKATKIWIMIAAVLVLAGCILFGSVMMILQWDFSKLGSNKYVTNDYTVSEEFRSLSIETDTANIRLAVSEDGKCRVECYDHEKVTYTVTVQDDILVVKSRDDRAWYEHIHINFNSPKLTVYLPQAEYHSLSIGEDTGDIAVPKEFQFVEVDISLSTGNVNFFASAEAFLKIKTTTGDIRMENLSAGSLDLSVSTGKVTVSGVNCEGDATIRVSTGKANLKDLTCENLFSRGNTGDIVLDHVIAVETMSIERTTGNVRFDGCDAAEVYVKTDTGDVTGSFLTDKVFIAETSTGKIDVPKTTAGGKCEVKTDTGNIKLQIQKSSSWAAPNQDVTGFE